MLFLFIYWAADVYLKYYTFVLPAILLLLSKVAAFFIIIYMLMSIFSVCYSIYPNIYLYCWLFIFNYLVLCLFLIKLIFNRLFAYSSSCPFRNYSEILFSFGNFWKFNFRLFFIYIFILLWLLVFSLLFQSVITL